MKSKITSKFQVTIPREIRTRLKLRVSDSIEWKIENGNVVVVPVSKPFLKYRACVEVGPGDIRKDIETGKKARAAKFT